MTDTLLIFGKNGMLGRYVYSYFTKNQKYKVIPVTRKEFNVTFDTLSGLEEFLISNNINNKMCIINCLGSIPQRYTSSSVSEYYLVNTIFPLLLSKLCKKYGVHYIHPSTDCVYKGTSGQYNEDSFHDEQNAYGQSKSLGESIDATVIRTSIIGEELANKTSLLEWVRNSKGTINGWTNHYWNGVTCLQWCKIIDIIISTQQFWKGARHVYSPTVKSKSELVEYINDVYTLNLNINPIKASVCVDKTLTSTYPLIWNIPELEDQIREQSKFTLLS
jgi:dTDP-4-dehydrorhamnose reductase